LLRPDVEFEDPSDDEWAAWILSYIRKNIENTKDGFTRKELCEALDVEYYHLQKCLLILSRRQLIKTGHWGRNVERICTPEYELCPADLTQLQYLVYDVLRRGQTPSGKIAISFEAIAATHENIKSGSVSAVLDTLVRKGYIQLEPRGYGEPRTYTVLRHDGEPHILEEA